MPVPTRKRPPSEVRLGTLHRRATVASVNEEARTVEVVWTTGAAVRRSGWLGDQWDETLSLEKGHVRTERLESGRMSLLEQHGMGRWSGNPLDAVIGVVEAGELIAGKEGRATLRFSRRERGEQLFREVADRIITNISVGYRVWRMEDRTKATDTVRQLVAVDWEPVELSLVDVPADAGAHSREDQGADRIHTCEIVTRQGTMDPELEQQGGATATAQPTGERATDQGAGASPAPPASDDALASARAEGARLERARVAGITEAVRKAGLEQALADQLVREGVTVDAARSRVLDQLATRSAEIDGGKPTSSRHAVQVTEAQRDGARSAMVSALLHRANPGQFQLTDQGRGYRGMTLLEIARECLEVRGQSSRGLGRLEVAQRAMQTTSDFPAIVADVANKSLLKAYEEAPRTWAPIVRERDAADFKPLNVAKLSAAPSLDEVGEHGEFTHGSLIDAKETYRVATYGKIVALTRQAIVNDDLGAFTRVPSLFAAAAARKQSDVIWALITSNPTLADGNALFSAAHGNDGVQILTDETDIQELVAKLRLQTGLKGELLNLSPAFLIVPTALELKALRLTTLLAPNTQGGVNPYASMLKPVVEPRLDSSSAVRWYMSTPTSQADIVELAYLDGQRTPVIETQQGFDVDGIKIRCRYDFGAGIVDHRGIARSLGTT